MSAEGKRNVSPALVPKGSINTLFCSFSYIKPQFPIYVIFNSFVSCAEQPRSDVKSKTLNPDTQSILDSGVDIV